jgi:hypothetical protein
MKYFNVMPFLKVEECECGGLFMERTSNTEYLTDPPQADFVCNKCGKIQRLWNRQWPKISYRLFMDSPLTEEEVYGSNR